MDFCFIQFVTLLHTIYLLVLSSCMDLLCPKCTYSLSLSLSPFLSLFFASLCLHTTCTYWTKWNSDQPHSLYTNIYMRITHQQTHTHKEWGGKYSVQKKSTNEYIYLLCLAIPFFPFYILKIIAFIYWFKKQQLQYIASMLCCTPRCTKKYV